MVANVNPYTNPGQDRASKGEAPGPIVGLYPHISAYAVPDIPETTDPENTDGGYSPRLDPGIGSGTSPDAIRIGIHEPPENDPNDPAYNRQRSSEFLHRHSVERYVHGWNVRQEKVPAGQNPLWTQERMPIRPTADDSPSGYMFFRPEHRPRHIQDAVGEDAIIHLSMADHRRDYPIMGMAPQGGVGTNTYRLDPQPWDAGLFHAPPEGNLAPNVNAVAPGNRGYRLG